MILPPTAAGCSASSPGARPGTSSSPGSPPGSPTGFIGGLAPATANQRLALAALQRFFVLLNPFQSVRSPPRSTHDGKTPWAGDYMVAGTPWIGYTEMYAQADLVRAPPPPPPPPQVRRCPAAAA